MKSSSKLWISQLSLIAILISVSFMGFISIISSPHYKLFVFVCIVAFLLKKHNRMLKRKGFTFFLVFLSFGILNIIINVINSGENSWIIVNLQCMTSMVFAYECYLFQDKRAIKVFVFVCNIWNLISFVDVLYKVFVIHYDSYKTMLLLCGYDNGLGAYLLPLSLLNLCLYFNNKKKQYLVCVIISSMQLFLIQSATAIVGITLLLVLFLLDSRSKKKISFIKPIHIFILDIITFVFIVLLRKYDNKFSRFIIENLLHKEMNFSGRLQTWNSGILYFLQKPIWGHGRNGTLQRSFFHTVTSSHNIFLDILDQVGIIGLTIFITLLLMIIIQEGIGKSRDCWIISIGVFVLIFVLQFESYCSYYGYALVFMIISFAYYLPLIADKNG